jgi:hypothetical protein
MIIRSCEWGQDCVSPKPTVTHHMQLLCTDFLRWYSHRKNKKAIQDLTLAHITKESMRMQKKKNTARNSAFACTCHPFRITCIFLEANTCTLREWKKRKLPSRTFLIDNRKFLSMENFQLYTNAPKEPNKHRPSTITKGELSGLFQTQKIISK